MKKGNYTMDDIVIGDEILFDDNHEKIEHNLFWRVVNKISPRKIVVEIREMGFAEKFIIDIRDIIELQRSGLQLEQIS